MVSLVKPYVYDQWDADKIRAVCAMLDGKAMIVAFVHVPKVVIPIVLTKYAQDEVYTIQCQANNGSFALGVFGMVTAPYLTTQTQNMSGEWSNSTV